VRLALFPTLALCFASLPASAGVVARINNATQRMTVLVDGRPTYSWPVSTARKGYQTPAGHYRVQRMERMWHSRKYHMSPMPHAMFFRGGYAIHGTYSVGQLGRRASHGCVRLSPRNAAMLFALARQRGGASVIVTNGAPAAYARLRTHRPLVRRAARSVRPTDALGMEPSFGYAPAGSIQPYGYGYPY